MVLPVSDYTQIAKEYMLPNQKKSQWEQFLTGTQTAFQQQAQQVQDVYSYDISQAYANYKKQQLQLQMNEKFGAGFQQQMGSELQTEYGTAYQDIKTQEASALTKVQEAYEEAYQEGESRFAQFGKTGQSLDNAIFEFAETQGYDFSDTTKLYKSRREGGYEFFKQTEDSAGNVTTELTEYGKDFYNKMLHGTENRFVEFLQENEDYEGLYDLYMANPDLYNYMVGGLEYGTRKYDETRMTKLLEQEKTNITQDLVSQYSQFSEQNLLSMSVDDLYALENKLKSTPSYVGTFVSKGFTQRNARNAAKAYDKFTDNYGNTYVTVKAYEWGQSTDNRKIKEINNALNVPKKLSSGTLSVGDIVDYDGKQYIIHKYKGDISYIQVKRS